MIPPLLWKNRMIITLAAFAALCLGEYQKIRELRAIIAARPAVESHIEKSDATKTTTGPTITREKYAVVQNCVPVLIERTVEAAPIVVEHIVEVKKDQSEKPACETKSAPRWLVGASADPFHGEDGQMIKAGTTIAGRLDLIGGVSTKLDRSELGFAVRF